MKNGRLELRLDDELRAKIDALSELRGISTSAVVRRSIIEAHRVAFPDAPVKSRRQVVVQDVPGVMPTTLFDFHTSLWGRLPSELQGQLYKSYGRGYVRGVTEEQVDAVITMALFLAPLRDAEAVCILAPPEVNAAVLRRVISAKTAARDQPFSSVVSAAIERMKMGVPTIWWPAEPPVWVAVGVPVDATVPRWLQKRLVEPS